MARISISQAMLLLTQGREIPVLKRALPIFNRILTKENLLSVMPSCLPRQSSVQRTAKYDVPSRFSGQVPAHPPSQDDNAVDAYGSPHEQGSGASTEWEQWQDDAILNIDILGFDFSDQWQQF